MGDSVKDWVRKKLDEGTDEEIIRDVLRSKDYSDSEIERLLEDNEELNHDFSVDIDNSALDNRAHKLLEKVKNEKLITLSSALLVIATVFVAYPAILDLSKEEPRSDMSCDYSYSLDNITIEDEVTTLEIRNDSPENMTNSELDIAFTSSYGYGTLTYVDHTNTDDFKPGDTLDVKIENEVNPEQFRMALKPRSDCNFVKEYHLDEEFEKRDLSLS